jgi:hypothetical protein
MSVLFPAFFINSNLANDVEGDCPLLRGVFKGVGVSPEIRLIVLLGDNKSDGLILYYYHQPLLSPFFFK